MVSPNLTRLAVEATPWPKLDSVSWKDTCATLHLWSQIVGKIRMVQTPWTNHSWHVPLYITARGLTTSPIVHGARTFQTDFDFCDHRLLITASDGARRQMALQPRSVADFYNQVFAHLTELGLNGKIHTTPSELVDGIPFEQDHQHASCSAPEDNRFWRALVQADRVFKQFRAGGSELTIPLRRHEFATTHFHDALCFALRSLNVRMR